MLQPGISECLWKQINGGLTTLIAGTSTHSSQSEMNESLENKSHEWIKAIGSSSKNIPTIKRRQTARLPIFSRLLPLPQTQLGVERCAFISFVPTSSRRFELISIYNQKTKRRAFLWRRRDVVSFKYRAATSCVGADGRGTPAADAAVSAGSGRLSFPIFLSSFSLN